MKVIARIRNDYDVKFGVPRQSGLVEEVSSRIVFEPEFRNPEAIRGIEEFSHLWLIWGFDRAEGREGALTVRPPRLGGNRRVGVFATRSPFRPNRIGLSCVRLKSIETGVEGPVLIVTGADLMNGTPLYDIKPYLPYTDCRPDATGGFTDRVGKRQVRVEIPEATAACMKPEEREALEAVLRQDPRPAYQDDPDREYAFEFGGHRVKFSVREDLLTVTGWKKER